MKIAIATNDRKTIAKRTGRAKEFAFYNLDESGKIISVNYEENQHKHDDEHDREQGYHRGHGKDLGRLKHRHEETHHHHHHEHGEHHHNEIIDQMKDVDVLLVRAVGKYLRQDLKDGNIPYKIIKKSENENIEEIVLSYWKSIHN